MSRAPYCKCCGGNGYEGSDCEALRAELKESRAATAKRLRQALRYRRAFRVFANTGIYPQAISGGPNAYSERSEWQNGWNACAMEIAKKIASALAARSIEDPDFEPVKEGAQ
jgi:hypothetical protein